MKIVPVILAGGVGSRLWPLSREGYPKHLLSFLGENSLLQDTLLRAKTIPHVLSPIIVTNTKHQAMVEEQLQQISVTDATVILEPVRRNTAPAIAAAALSLTQKVDDALMLVLPADLIIKDVAGFVKSIEHARPFAEHHHIVTFGVKPEYPETGYGYINRAHSLTDHCFEVAKFVEKPDQANAEKYIASGEYFWNSGIYLLSVSQYLKSVDQFTPGIVKPCEQAVDQAKKIENKLFLDKSYFSQAVDISVDNALTEKADNIVMALLAADWRDAGSWKSLYDIDQHDEQGNVLLGEVVAEDVHSCYVRGEKNLLAVLGVKDLVIVESDGVVLVAHKDKVQCVKELVKKLKR